MNLPLYIARKYFFSRKISNVIHVISLIAVLGIFFGTAALIIILSVFNGFESVVGKLYASFDSDIKIEPANSKYFEPDSLKMAQIAKLANIRAITPVIEENALFKYRDNQNIGTIKAINPGFIKFSGIDTMLVAGNDTMHLDSASYIIHSGGEVDSVSGPIDYAILGGGLANRLNIHGFDAIHPIQVFYPRKGGEISMFNQASSVSRKNIRIGGIFSIQQDFDNRYVLAPIQFARQLFDEPKAVTSIEIILKDKNAVASVQSKIASILGPGFTVSDRFQQHPSLYKVMHVEKAAVYLVLCLILLIATFNLVGALLMLTIEKQKDMAVLLSMGAEPGMVRRIVSYEGLLLSVSGGILGMLIGGIICWLQMQFGFIKLGGDDSTFVINAYPVAFKTIDFVLVFITVLVLGFLASWYPARMANKKINAGLLSSRE